MVAPPPISHTDTAGDGEFKGLITDKAYLQVPKVGTLVTGTVVGIGRNEIKIDLPGFRTGIVRGPEVLDASGDTASLKVGDSVEATVLDLENERGFVELSFRAAGHQKAWGKLDDLRRSGEILSARVLDANKGGLIVELGKLQGFLPVSQLSPSNYPRVTGGDKQKILEKLRTYIGRAYDVKIIDVDSHEEKLICSEKAAWEESQSQVLAQYHVGDHITGRITALADFGAFVRFPIPAADAPVDDRSYLEGLVHISELSWQRVDHPRDVLTIGDEVTVVIINIEKSKIFLSVKRLTADPWIAAAERYHVGQRVRGKVVKVQPFGLFVELDEQIHGLAHMSELGDPPPASPSDIAKVGDELESTIISLDPKEHRLGLSLKPQTPPANDAPQPDTTEKLPEAPASPAAS